jgi:hypothetical protein
MECKDCGNTEFWDNRQTKRNPRAPDYKCKQCGKAVWERNSNRGNGNGGSAPAPNGPTTPHAVLYKLCVQYAKKEIMPLLSVDATDDNLLAAAATLFIQASKGGACWPVRKAEPAPPPPPPDPIYDGSSDGLPF